MAKRTIADVEVATKRVLMRVDFNVPLGDGQITDDLRIRMAVPSIENVLERQGRLILISHLRRPAGIGPEPGLSLSPCAERLGQLLGRPVAFANDCVGAETAAAVSRLDNGHVLVLENLRFHAEEKKGDRDFASQLAALADIYCNDAFGTAHRRDASMVAIPSAMGIRPKVAGLLLQKELQYLSEAIEDPRRPLVAILGGAKVSDKIGVITNLLDRVNTILIGGAMAYTFMAAQHQAVGDSRVETDQIEQALGILDEVDRSRADMILPTDHVCGKQLSRNTPTTLCNAVIDDGYLGLDIGPRTVNEYTDHVDRSQTVVWNGPLGAFETPPFDGGTHAIADAVTRATTSGCTSIIGGGDIAAAIRQFGMSSKFTHVSTGGGACLAMLAGRQFESVELLDDR